MTNLEFLKQAEAWLSFNRWPSREQMGNFKTSLVRQIAISEAAPQTEANAFTFSEWCNANYIRLRGCWVGRYESQTNPNNGKSTEQLWHEWAKLATA